eukprot:scaffold57809_cov33-Tisochrysis_lutea.AAC.3
MARRCCHGARYGGEGAVSRQRQAGPAHSTSTASAAAAGAARGHWHAHSRAQAPVVMMEAVKYNRVMSGISKYHSSKPAMAAAAAAPPRRSLRAAICGSHPNILRGEAGK